MSIFDANLQAWIKNMGFSKAGHGLPLKLANNGVENIYDILHLSRKEYIKIFAETYWDGSNDLTINRTQKARIDMAWIYTRNRIANEGQTANDFPSWKLDDFVEWRKKITSIEMDNMQPELEKLALNASNFISFKEQPQNCKLDADLWHLARICRLGDKDDNPFVLRCVQANIKSVEDFRFTIRYNNISTLFASYEKNGAPTPIGRGLHRRIQGAWLWTMDRF